MVIRRPFLGFFGGGGKFFGVFLFNVAGGRNSESKKKNKARINNGVELHPKLWIIMKMIFI